MADVRPGGHGGSTERSSRGQLLLVAALGLAILFVSLALIVNTAIYTENLATRGSDIGGGTEAVRYQDAVRSGVGGLIEFANYHENTSHDTLQTELVAGVDAIDNRTGQQFAMSNRAVETSLNTTVNGTRIAQTDDSRNFSNVSGTADWTVVQDVEHTRAYTVNVTSSSLLIDLGGSNPFRIVVDTGSSTWRMNITQTTVGSDVVVGIEDGNGNHFECPAVAPPVVIDVSAGTVGDVECDGLKFGDGIGSPYNISYSNADNIEGTYSLVVDNATLADDVETGANTHLADDGSGQPFATHAIYSANVTATYQTPRLYYNVTVRVAPGEPDG